MIEQQKPNSRALHKMALQWEQVNSKGALMKYNIDHGNIFMPPHGVDSCDLKMKGQDLQRDGMHNSYVGSQNMVFQMQSTHQYPHA